VEIDPGRIHRPAMVTVGRSATSTSHGLWLTSRSPSACMAFSDHGQETDANGTESTELTCPRDRIRASRATLETPAPIKNPPTAFARQANIANGPQQVNNTTVVPDASRVRANPESVPTELLEAHVERVDTGAAQAPGRGDQAVETVGIVNRPQTEAGKRRSSRNRDRGGQREQWRGVCRQLRTALSTHDRSLRGLL
jgi:hypothetical protein